VSSKVEGPDGQRATNRAPSAWRHKKSLHPTKWCRLFGFDRSALRLRTGHFHFNAAIDAQTSDQGLAGFDALALTKAGFGLA
jgi:hypothetical protein